MNIKFYDSVKLLFDNGASINFTYPTGKDKEQITFETPFITFIK